SKIDYLVMTHPDADHIGGMSKVIDNFDIGNIYMTDRISTTKTFEDLLLKIESKNLNITTLKANDTISEFNDGKVILLSPIKKYDDSNEMSLVIQIIYKNNTFLFMGDAGYKVENDILNSNANIKADLIKIGHHGSSYSSSIRFIEKVSPLFAIISVGKNNRYGHPTNQTLETLKKIGAKIYRTDESGDIIAISDGNSINITSKN
ncbi:MAG: MBL fold metallo-hydrolase, partial [Methanobrevibacter sp.]|nr:MBL fold metallo-hydrolase [Methanobrevibacter sp.]